VKADLNIATYDFRDPEQSTLFREQNIERMKCNIADKLKDLEAKGIIDKDGAESAPILRPICSRIRALTSPVDVHA
jgi:hypothetical protein